MVSIMKPRCCINRAKAVDVYAQRSPASPYQLRFQSNCLIFPRKCARTHKTGEPKVRYGVRN
ncbi:MAG: hypothetical protein E5299_01232 [Burkholderia gladioli]|nr:MAG: hypothetical protein E5299_01232 [Burkholderia gladioli]